MKYPQIAATAILVLALSSCAALTPKSFDQSLALGYAAETAVLQTAKSALARKEITKDDATRILAISDQAGAALDRARAIRGSDMATAQAELELASQVLDQLSAYLEDRR